MMQDRPGAVVIIAAHKQCPLPADAIYMPVQVGAALHPDIGYCRDDTGENISRKNPEYSELTGLYWMWKNVDADYLGLVHYRRYFVARKKRKCALSDVLSSEQLYALIPQYRVIVPRRTKYYIESLYSHYSHTFYEDHLIETRKIIQSRCPEYTDVYDRTLRQRYGFMYNMVIMERGLLDEYCAWLFDILSELEERVDTENMSAFHRRFCGRISERLFNVWLNYQLETGRLSCGDIRELPYMYLGEVNWFRKITSFLMAKVCHRKYEKSF